MAIIHSADMVMINYGLSPEAWDKLQKMYSDHLAAHPICEMCRREKSARITPLGAVKAACMNCIGKQQEEILESYRTLEED